MKTEEIAIQVNKFIHEQCIDSVSHDIGMEYCKTNKQTFHPLRA